MEHYGNILLVDYVIIDEKYTYLSKQKWFVELTMDDRCRYDHEPDEATDQSYPIPPNTPCGVAVVYVLADRLECDPLELPELLASAIDVDALNAMFAHNNGPPAGDPSLLFQYCGYIVRVRTGELTLRPRSSDE